MQGMHPQIFQIFIVGFLLNLIWEFAHCQLYETCRRQTWAQNAPLLLKMSLKDGLFVVLFYSLTALIFRQADILSNNYTIAFLLILALGFAFIDEKISVRLKRWEYAIVMPTIFGVGITPLLEIALTGLLAIGIIFRFLN